MFSRRSERHAETTSRLPNQIALFLGAAVHEYEPFGDGGVDAHLEARATGRQVHDAASNDRFLWVDDDGAELGYQAGRSGTDESAVFWPRHRDCLRQARSVPTTR